MLDFVSSRTLYELAINVSYNFIHKRTYVNANVLIFCENKVKANSTLFSCIIFECYSQTANPTASLNIRLERTGERLG